MFKTAKLTFDELKSIIVALIPCLLLGCVQSSSYRTHEKPEALNQTYVVRLDPNGNGSQVKHFLNAHKQKLSAGVCETSLTEEGTLNDLCIITNNGKASLIVDYTQDEYAGSGGYRISKLKQVKINKFYSRFYKSYWTLEPYIPD